MQIFHKLRYPWSSLSDIFTRWIFQPSFKAIWIIIPCYRADKLRHIDGETDGLTDIRTGGRTDGRMQATTVPLQTEGVWGKSHWRSTASPFPCSNQLQSPVRTLRLAMFRLIFSTHWLISLSTAPGCITLDGISRAIAKWWSTWNRFVITGRYIVLLWHPPFLTEKKDSQASHSHSSLYFVIPVKKFKTIILHRFIVGSRLIWDVSYTIKPPGNTNCNELFKTCPFVVQNLWETKRIWSPHLTKMPSKM